MIRYTFIFSVDLCSENPSFKGVRLLEETELKENAKKENNITINQVGGRNLLGDVRLVWTTTNDRVGDPLKHLATYGDLGSVYLSYIIDELHKLTLTTGFMESLEIFLKFRFWDAQDDLNQVAKLKGLNNIKYKGF